MLVSENSFYDFKFGSKSLSDFGGTIINTDGWHIKNGITLEKNTSKLTGRSGEILSMWNYSKRLIDFSVYVDEDFDFDEFSAWLLDGEQVFSFEGSGREIDAIFDNTVDLKSYYNNGDYQGVMELTFVAYNPFWRIQNERSILKDNPNINEIIYIRNRGNMDSAPIIKIVPKTNQSQTIMFNWNDEMITLRNITKTVYINSIDNTMYYLNEEPITYNYVSNEYYDFPIVKYNKKNTFKLINGDVSQIDIQLNSRIR